MRSLLAVCFALVAMLFAPPALARDPGPFTVCLAGCEAPPGATKDAVQYDFIFNDTGTGTVSVTLSDLNPRDAQGNLVTEPPPPPPALPELWLSPSVGVTVAQREGGVWALGASPDLGYGLRWRPLFIPESWYATVGATNALALDLYASAAFAGPIAVRGLAMLTLADAIGVGGGVSCSLATDPAGADRCGPIVAFSIRRALF